MTRPVVAIRLRALGDVVLWTPALASLARGHADAPLHVVTEARFAPILEALPHVAKVWPLERTNASTLATITGLRRERPALAVDFFGNTRSALIARGSGAPRVWGFALRGRRLLYHATAPREQRTPEGRREPASAVHVRLARAAGGAEVDPAPRLALSGSAHVQGARLLAECGVREPANTVGLVPAGSWATKTWPLSHSALLARALLEAGYEVIALSGPGEQGVVERLRALAPPVRALPDCGVAALAGAIAPLRAVVGTDSGPRHVAAALGVPSFAWFGPTHPETWNPPGVIHGYWQSSLPCRGCDRTSCPHWSCLPSLSGEQGARLVLAHLEAHPRPA
jgi:ADP-heptose:LPS heptosyltransferase